MHNTILLDQNHVIDLINQTNDETSELAYHLNKAQQSAIRIKEASKWTRKAFPNGPDPVKHSEETEFNIAYIIGEVESDHQEHMPAFQYAACHNRCIHCTGSHTSEDHHLSLAIPLVSNSGTTIIQPHQETKTTNEAISNTSNNYKTKGKPLPSQQSAFLHAHWTPPRPPTPPITSQPSMEGKDSRKSTDISPISSTTSRISDLMPPPHSRQVRFMPTETRERRSSRFSKKNASASKPSSSSSTASIRIPAKSSISTRNRKSPTTRIGEHSHGDHSWIGNNSRRTHHQQTRNDSSSQTAPGSTRAHGKPARSNKRACLTAANFFDNDSRDVDQLVLEYGDDPYVNNNNN